MQILRARRLPDPKKHCIERAEWAIPVFVVLCESSAGREGSRVAAKVCLGLGVGPASSLGFIIQPRQSAIDAGLTQHPRGDISRIETILKLKCAEPLLQSILVSIPQSSIVDQMNGISHIFPRSRHLCVRNAPTRRLAIDQRHLSATRR